MPEGRPASIGRTIRGITKLPRVAYRKYRAGRVLLTALRKLARKEREWQVPMRRRRPRWWLKGFLSRSAILYDLDRNDPGLYVSDLQRYFRTKKMVHPQLQEVINNKLTTHLLLGHMDIPSAKLLGVYSRGMVHRFPQQGAAPVARYLEEMKAGETTFFKVLAGAEGKNIFAFTRRDELTWDVNGAEMPLQNAARILTKQVRPLIAEAGLEQHAEQAALYPRAVNTLRVLTMIDLEAGHEPFIALAVQRIGSRRSEPADNWTRGGLSASVDLETGTLSSATRLPDGDVKEWFDHHPDNGAQIAGTQVPYWEEVRELVLRSARVLSFMEYIGWDIVVGPEGPIVLEANVNSGMNVLQSHRPLFADPRVRRYFAERGVRTVLAQAQAQAEEEPSTKDAAGL